MEIKKEEINECSFCSEELKYRMITYDNEIIYTCNKCLPKYEISSDIKQFEKLDQSSKLWEAAPIDIETLQKWLEPYVKPYWIAEWQTYHSSTFVMPLEFKKPINLKAAYSEGNFWNTNGGGLITHTNPTHISVRSGSSSRSYYMNENSAVITLQINLYTTKKKTYYTLEEIRNSVKKCFSNLLENGIYVMDTKYDFEDWRKDQDETYKAMKNLAEWWSCQLWKITYK